MSDDTDWTLIDFSEPKKGAALVAPSHIKGQCQTCKKHIGKGIAFHVKRCTGNDDARNAQS